MAEQELTVLKERSSPQSELSELESAEQELDSQERMFCYEYLTDYNAPRAAVHVGRASSAGRKFLRKPAIARFIHLLGDELIADSLITRDMVQYELLHEFLPRARGDKTISGVDRDGIQFEAKVTNMAAYAKALDLMSKHSGFTVAEVVVGGVTVNLNFENLGVSRPPPIEGECSEPRISSQENTEESG